MSTGMLIVGGLSAIGFIILLAKMNRIWLRRLLGYDLYVDIIVTLGFMYFMAGTYSGAIAAVISGIIFSLILWVIKLTVGAEKLTIQNGSPTWTRIK